VLRQGVLEWVGKDVSSGRSFLRFSGIGFFRPLSTED
jgi:hypothetical protein